MTGLTRQQVADAVASLFGTTAVHSRSSRTYDPWEVTDNERKTWRFVYDSSIQAPLDQFQEIVLQTIPRLLPQLKNHFSGKVSLIAAE